MRAAYGVGGRCQAVDCASSASTVDPESSCARSPSPVAPKGPCTVSCKTPRHRETDPRPLEGLLPHSPLHRPLVAKAPPGFLPEADGPAVPPPRCSSLCPVVLFKLQLVMF